MKVHTENHRHSDDHAVHHHHKRHHHSRSQKSFKMNFGRKTLDRKDSKKVLLLLASFLLIAGIAIFGISRWEQQRFAVTGAEGSVIADTAFSTPKMITVDGTVYRRKRNVDSYLFLGVDVDGTVMDAERLGVNGQADVQILMAVDRTQKTWQLLQLNRDSLVEFDVLGVTGKVIGSQKAQLALAHAYGSSPEMGCRNAVRAISRLLWDQQINGYAALNMDGIGILNDALGGVTVAVTSDFTAVDPSLELGSTVTLNGELANSFLRARKGVDDQTNLSRMARHQAYLTALTQKLMTQDAAALLDAYGKVKNYTVSNMDDRSLVSLTEKMKTYSQLPTLTVDGENIVLDEHIAYLLDDGSLREAILELFYEIV